MSKSYFFCFLLTLSLIKGSESPEKHFMYVCENIISKASAKTIVVVAHSYGGIVIVNGVSTVR